MNRCVNCGQPCQDELCLDCRYRHGGHFVESEIEARDLLWFFHQERFSAGFTWEQLTLVAEYER